MTATFDPTLTTTRDRLRFQLGDTDISAPLLEDVTYDAALALYPDWRSAGVDLATALASRFAQEPDSIAISGEITLSWRARVQNWTRLAALWAAELGTSQSGIASTRALRDVVSTGEYVLPRERW